MLDESELGGGWGVGGGEVERRSGELMSTSVLGLRVITGCYHE